MPAAFLQKMDQATVPSQSLLCIGLDPDPARTPANDLLRFNQEIIEATHDLAAAYKPNLAFYEARGRPGLQALADTLDRIRITAPHALIIGDAKRGDIGPSAAAYAQAMFSTWDFDAITVNPWGGLESLRPFLDYPERGVFLWLRGSHPGAAELQDLTVESLYGRIPLWEHLARQVQEQDPESQRLGLVVGATAPVEVLQTVRRLSPDRPLLLPGIGVQGGDPAAAARLAADSRGRRALLSASRSVMYAGTGKGQGKSVRQAAAVLRQAINEALSAAGRSRN